MAKPAAEKTEKTAKKPSEEKKSTIKRTSLRKRTGCSVYLAVFFFFAASFFMGLTLIREYIPTVVIGYLLPSLQKAFPDCSIDVSVKSAKLFRANVSCSVYSEKSDGGIKADLSSITIDYTPWSLMRGRVSSIVLENANVFLADNPGSGTETFDGMMNDFLSVLADPPVDAGRFKTDGIVVINEGEYGFIPVRVTSETFTLKKDGARSYRLSLAASSLGKSSFKFDGEYDAAGKVLDGACSFFLSSGTVFPCIRKYCPAFADFPFSSEGSGKIVFSCADRRIMEGTCISATVTPEENEAQTAFFPVSPFAFKVGSDDGKSILWDVRRVRTSVGGFEPEIASLVLKQSGSSAKGSAIVVLGPGLELDAAVSAEKDENGNVKVSVKSGTRTISHADNGTVRLSGGKADLSADFSFMPSGGASGSFSLRVPDAEYVSGGNFFSSALADVTGTYSNGEFSSEISASGAAAKSGKLDFKAEKLVLSAKFVPGSSCSGKLSFDNGCARLAAPDGDLVIADASAVQDFVWSAPDGFLGTASSGTYSARKISFRDNQFAGASGTANLSGKKLSLSGSGTVCGRKYSASAEFSPDGDNFVEIVIPRQNVQTDDNSGVIPLRGFERVKTTNGEVKGRIRLSFADGKIDPVMLLIFSNLSFELPDGNVSASGGNVVQTDAGRSVSFSSLRCGRIEFGQTNVTVSYGDDGVIIVENANARFCGGTIKLMPVKFDRRSGKLHTEAVCRDLDAELLMKTFLPNVQFRGNMAFSGVLLIAYDGTSLSILPGSILSSVNEKYADTSLSAGQGTPVTVGTGRSRAPDASLGVEIPKSMAENALKRFYCSWCRISLSGDTENGVKTSIVTCGRPGTFTGYAFNAEDRAFVPAGSSSSPDDEMVLNLDAPFEIKDLGEFISWLSNRSGTNR